MGNGWLCTRADGALTWKADPALSSQPRQDVWLATEDEHCQGFADLVCPVLVVRGSDSDVIDTNMEQRMRHTKPRAGRIHVEYAGHNGPQDQPRPRNHLV